MEDIKRIENLESAVTTIAHRLTSTDTNYAGLAGKIHEILNPPNEDDFLECDTCRAKPGSPTLCKGCLHNRSLIYKIKEI